MQTLSHVYKINLKHAQISNTIWRRIGPFSIDLVKKKKKKKNAHTHWLVTTPSHTLGHDWTHIAQYTVTKFELSQYTTLKLKVCRFLHNTGIRTHVCQCAAYMHKYQTQIDEELVHSVLTSLKKNKKKCVYTDYSHNSIITHPGTWLDAYCSDDCHHFNQEYDLFTFTEKH